MQLLLCGEAPNFPLFPTGRGGEIEEHAEKIENPHFNQQKYDDVYSMYLFLRTKTRTGEEKKRPPSQTAPLFSRGLAITGLAFFVWRNSCLLALAKCRYLLPRAPGRVMFQSAAPECMQI